MKETMNDNDQIEIEIDARCCNHTEAGCLAWGPGPSRHTIYRHQLAHLEGCASVEDTSKPYISVLVIEAVAS